ncbi:MAG: tRNA glutamyl-Q(34) synthetase GluQRS, partial [Cyanobium sp.]
APRYGHVPLWCDGQGQRLSKREASEGLDGLRAQGLDAAGVVGDLAVSLALVPAGSRLSAAELLASLSQDQFTQALRAGHRAEASGLAGP